MKLPRLKGEFWIADKLCYSTLTPRITHTQGLVLNRLDEHRSTEIDVIAKNGPHFQALFIRPYLFSTYHTADQMKKGPHYQFSGTSVGAVWQYSGRDAFESGTLHRAVSEMNVSLSFVEREIRCDISGISGAVSEFDPGYTANLDKTQLFRIWFVIPLDLVTQTAEVGDAGLKQLTALLASIA
jgi:hypothetical protein